MVCGRDYRIVHTAHWEEMPALLQKATEAGGAHAYASEVVGEDMEDVLSTFETVAAQQGWPQDTWAVQLAGVLSGKAMAAYIILIRAESGYY